MKLQPEKHTVAIYILPYISRIRDNQSAKFNQLIEYNIRNIFRGVGGAGRQGVVVRVRL